VVEDALLKDLRKNCDMSLEENKEAVNFLKNKVLENVKERVKKNIRLRRISSASSIASFASNRSKRKHESELNQMEPKSSKLSAESKSSLPLPKPVQ
jgi:hypothetical protein